VCGGDCLLFWLLSEIACSTSCALCCCSCHAIDQLWRTSQKMGYAMFFGCFFIALGPAAAIFYYNVSHSPQLIILTIGSAFFWVLSIFLTSIWWYIIPPLRDIYIWTIIWAVGFQELFRFLFLYLYQKAEKSATSKSSKTAHLMTHPDNLNTAIAFGLGAGVVQCMITYVSILWEAIGPGSYFAPSCPSVNIFILSALHAFIFILLHVLWSIVAFDGYRTGSKLQMGLTVTCHYVASILTLLNLPGGSCVAALLLSFALLVGWAFYTWRVLTKATFGHQTHPHVKHSRLMQVEMAERTPPSPAPTHTIDED